MERRCSHCGNNGHNSRTCSSPRSGMGGGGGGLRLFGVQLRIASPLKKSISMGCLSSSSSSSSLASLSSLDEANDKTPGGGYLSDGLMGRSQERKKGVPWTEEEHRSFLIGLEKLGKGDWRGISRNFVVTRTPTQVASHAQKYFLRRSTLSKKRRRSSLFDAVGSCERAAHVTDSSKSRDPSSLRDLRFPTLSLYTTSGGVDGDTAIDLNCEEQEKQVPSCLCLLPNSPSLMSSSPGLLPEPPSFNVEPQVHLPLPDLELTSSSSQPLDQDGSDSSSLYMGIIRVT